MKIGLLAIGDELLAGDCIDTNSQFLAKTLFDLGLYLTKKVTCGDHDVEACLADLLRECNFVITSGGLGPTHDDRTKAALASHFQKALISRPDIKHSDPEFLFPEDFETIDNPIGSAPGMFLEEGGRRVAALPGVPFEFRAMTLQWLVPYLEEKHLTEGERWFGKSIHFCQIKESQIASALSTLEKKYPNLQIGVYPRLGSVSVKLRMRASSEEEFERLVRPAFEELQALYPTLIYSSPSGLIEEALHERLRKTKETLALAESCSGGAMAARFTQYSEASRYFLGSFVTYSDEVKQQALGVSKKTLQTQGAVSQGVVEEMARGVFKQTDAIWAVSISGIAGPTGGTVEKPVGTIWAAIGKRGESIATGLIPMKSGRERHINIEYSVTYLLSALWRKMIYHIEPFS